jgi:cytochrome c-type biogenesis protein
MGRAALYLMAYSAGLGLPFLAAAVFFDRFLPRAVKLRPYLPLIQRLSGLLLLFLGLFILFGQYQALNILLIRSEYTFIAWTQRGGPGVRFVPALLFFLLALLPVFLGIFRKRPLFSRGMGVFSGIFTILAVLQAAGWINAAELLTVWFLYRQGV